MDRDNLNNTSSDLYMLLLSINRQIFNHDEMIKNSNMPPSHIKVLFYLIHTGPCAISEVAKNLSISKPNMTPIIDKLESEGFLERFQDSKDRRIIRVRSTNAACIFLKKKEEMIKMKLKEKLSPLSDEELLELNNSISIMTKLILKI